MNPISYALAPDEADESPSLMRRCLHCYNPIITNHKIIIRGGKHAVNCPGVESLRRALRRERESIVETGDIYIRGAIPEETFAYFFGFFDYTHEEIEYNRQYPVVTHVNLLNSTRMLYLMFFTADCIFRPGDSVESLEELINYDFNDGIDRGLPRA